VTASAQPAPAKTPSVLIVDDDAAVCTLLADVLIETRVTVETCGNGGDAVRLLSARNYDVVLLDLGLPDMDGLELLKAFTADNCPTRFIIITANDTPDAVIEAVRGNAYGYIRKPFYPQQVRDLVAECLQAPAEPPIEVLSAKPEWFELSLPCTRAAANRIDNFMRQFKLAIPDELREMVAHAFRELLMNAVEWGGGLDPERRVRVSCLRTRRMLFYRIADPGPGFRFERLAHAAVGRVSDGGIGHVAVREALGMRPGGFGLLMVQAMADELLFNEKQNEVVLVKYLD
jgi:DNA-binding response OmpR family regulator